MMERMVCLLIGYVCGNFLTGYLIGKTKDVDIRTVGSGNVGTTNTYRNLGPAAGALTLVGDILKVVVAILLAWALFHKSGPEMVKLLQYYAGVGAVLGHNFPVVMKLKGGKGIACTGGMVLSLCPICAPISIGLMLLAIFTIHYMSLASILGLISLFVQVVIFGQNGMLGVGEAYLPEVYVLMGVLAALGILRHQSNIKRLISGNENKFYFSSKKKI